MEPTEVSCREIVEVITDYIEGALPEQERAAFARHLLGCPHCVRYIEQMRETIRLTGSLTEASLAATERQALLAAFRTWRAS